MTRYLDVKTLRDDGYLQEVNRAFFHPLGLALEVVVDQNCPAILRIQDFRDDPEGVRYEGLDLRPKANRLMEIHKFRRLLREKALGYWQQPISSEVEVRK